MGQADVLVQRAAALAEDGELHASEQLFLQAVTAYEACAEAASGPGLARACEMCAQVQLEMGNVQDALSHAQRATALQPQVRPPPPPLRVHHEASATSCPLLLAPEVSAWAHARMAPRRGAASAHCCNAV